MNQHPPSLPTRGRVFFWLDRLAGWNQQLPHIPSNGDFIEESYQDLGKFYKSSRGHLISRPFWRTIFPSDQGSLQGSPPVFSFALLAHSRELAGHEMPAATLRAMVLRSV